MTAKDYQAIERYCRFGLLSEREIGVVKQRLAWVDEACRANRWRPSGDGAKA